MTPCSTRGFTLIEVMVVIVIAGIMVTMATIAISDRSASELEQEGRRLNAIMRLMGEEAIMQSKELGMAFNKRGYQFYEVNDEDQWQAISLDEELRPRELHEEIKIRLYTDGEEVSIKNDMPENPAIFFFSSGETTPFELVLRLGDYRQIISSNAFGDITLDALTEE